MLWVNFHFLCGNPINVWYFYSRVRKISNLKELIFLATGNELDWLLLNQLYGTLKFKHDKYTTLPVCLTFYDFFRVIEKEFAERWSFGSFERVQQLLDLSGHPAADGHAWTNTENRHSHKHMLANKTDTRSSILNTNLYVKVLQTSTVIIGESSRKDLKGKSDIRRLRLDRILENKTGSSLLLKLRHQTKR